MDTTTRILVKITILGLTVLLLRQYIEFITPSVEGYTQPIVIAIRLYTIVIYPVLFTRNPTKLAIII